MQPRFPRVRSPPSPVTVDQVASIACRSSLCQERAQRDRVFGGPVGPRRRVGPRTAQARRTRQGSQERGQTHLNSDPAQGGNTPEQIPERGHPLAFPEQSRPIDHGNTIGRAGDPIQHMLGERPARGIDDSLIE